MGWGPGRLAALAAMGVVCAGMLAGVSQAAEIGANDDTAKYVADGGATFYGQMAALGLRQSVLSVRFRPSEPTRVPAQDAIDAAVEQARAAGLAVVFSVYPYPPRELAAGKGSPAAFASWLSALAVQYPQVRQYVVGNEPNQTAFVRPQFGSNRRNVSAATAGAYLAAGYDALKAIDPSITVVGVGLSPRGNDDPRAPNNPSVSPLRFLEALGRWYRASGRSSTADGRLQLPPLPEERSRRARAGLHLAERGLRQPRPRQAGALGRVPRDGAADDRRRPAALPGRGRVAGRHVRVGRVLRRRERPRDDRGGAGRDLPGHRSPGGVRPERRRGELLRVLRRQPAQRLPGGSLSRQRNAAALGRCRQAGGRRHRARLPGRSGRSGHPRPG